MSALHEQTAEEDQIVAANQNDPVHL